MLLDQVFALAPHSEARAFEAMRAYVRHVTENGIDDMVSGAPVDAGLVGDAERDGLPVRADSGVAIVSIMGPMVRRAGPLARMFGIAGTDGARLAIEVANADPSISSILLRLDSPGGSVSGLDQLGASVRNSAKPVTAVVDGMAASAAYYVASQATRIVAGGSDLVGSIGTRMLLYDFSKAFENDGIEAVPIDSGAFKSAGAVGTKITAEQRADFQRLVDFYFADFLDAVSGGRRMTQETLRPLADGRLFTAPEAIKSGLIDGVGTYGDTLRAMRVAPSRRSDSARARLRL